MQEVREYLNFGVPVGPHLADQLLLPLGISAYLAAKSDSGPDSLQSGGSYRTLPLTEHSTTHMDLLRQFLGVQIEVDALADGQRIVHVRPPGG